MPNKPSKSQKKLKPQYFQPDLFNEVTEKKALFKLGGSEQEMWDYIAKSFDNQLLLRQNDIVIIDDKIKNFLVGEAKASPQEIELVVEPKPSLLMNRPSLARLLSFWELFPFILPPKIRRQIYEPAYNDLLIDFFKTSSVKSKWGKRWLAFCFTWRTAYMVFECLQVTAGAWIKGLCCRSVVELFRKFSGG